MAQIMDHRNEGFDAKRAHYEDVSTKTKMINRQITTKVGLKDYTREECEAMAGEVIEYNYNKRYSWDEFKAMPVQNKEEYLRHLANKYQGLLPIDLCRMFGISRTGFDKAVKKLKVTFARTGSRYMSEGRKQFYADLITPWEDFILPEFKIPEVENYISAEEPEPVRPTTYKLDYLELTCNGEDLGDILQKMGITGKVQVSIKSVTEGSIVPRRVTYSTMGGECNNG